MADPRRQDPNDPWAALSAMDKRLRDLESELRSSATTVIDLSNGSTVATLGSGGVNVFDPDGSGDITSVAAAIYGLTAAQAAASVGTNSSVSAVDLTGGPEVPVHIGESGRLLILGSATASLPSGAAGGAGELSAALSGSPGGGVFSDIVLATSQAPSGTSMVASLTGFGIITGLSVGDVYARLQYRAPTPDGTTTNFQARTILVFPL